MRGRESAQSQDKGSAITGLWPGSTPYIFFLQFLCDFFQVNMINSENSAGITHSLRAFVITYPSIPFLYLLLLLCFNFSSSIFFSFLLSLNRVSFFFLSFFFGFISSTYSAAKNICCLHVQPLSVTLLSFEEPTLSNSYPHNRGEADLPVTTT